MWKEKEPFYGDQIRVNRGLYYHHGIYESDDVVYQFASPEGSEISPDTAIICITTLEKFLKGGTLEVREYDEAESEKKKSPLEVIQTARSFLGDDFGGYSLIDNNCEHFSNYCVFGTRESRQADTFKDIFGNIFGGRK